MGVRLLQVYQQNRSRTLRFLRGTKKESHSAENHQTMNLIPGKPWHETQQQKLADGDLRRLHAIRAACRSLRDALHGADWFSSVSHDAAYKTIVVNTVGDVPREAGFITTWEGFKVFYQPQK